MESVGFILLHTMYTETKAEVFLQMLMCCVSFFIKSPSQNWASVYTLNNYTTHTHHLTFLMIYLNKIKRSHFHIWTSLLAWFFFHKAQKNDEKLDHLDQKLTVGAVSVRLSFHIPQVEHIKLFVWLFAKETEHMWLHHHTCCDHQYRDVYYSITVKGCNGTFLQTKSCSIVVSNYNTNVLTRNAVKVFKSEQQTLT